MGGFAVPCAVSDAWRIGQADGASVVDGMVYFTNIVRYGSPSGVQADVVPDYSANDGSSRVLAYVAEFCKKLEQVCEVCRQSDFRCAQ